MRGSDARALGDAGGDLVEELTGWVEGVHRAVARRVFRYTPGSRPIRLVHDTISRGVYATVRGVVAGGARAAGVAADLLLDDERPALTDTPRGNAVVGAVNGIIGDRLERDGNGLAFGLTLRHGGRDVAPAELAARVEAPTGSVAVFLHGLCETDASWCWRAIRHHGAPRASHPDRLAEELGYTSVLVRYNTGRHISDNGADLAAVLDELVGAWPVEVEQLVLIGHSMGGLVARSATVRAADDGAPWVERLRHVVCLGSPNLGAPLEKVVNVGAWALALVAETAPFGDLLNTRSAGIKDLRFGYTLEDEWRDRHPDELMRNRRAAAQALDHVRYHAISATLGVRDRGVAAEVVGDLLVPPSSAAGRARRGHPVAFHGHDHLPSLDHFDLLAHPEVTERIVGALRGA